MTENIDTNTHYPVLLKPLLEIANSIFPKKGVVFDGTVGGGGYTQAFLEQKWQVWAGDLDELALDFVQGKSADPNLKLLHGDFAELISTFEDTFFNLIVVDLGFSSNQLEFSNRGFSYLKNQETLDLRYNSTQGEACWQKLQSVQTVDKLCKTIFTYSGESLSKPIAKSLYELSKSQSSAITVDQAVEAIVKVIPKKFLKHKYSILSRVWQALRIWTNQEMEILQKFLDIAPQKLKVNGLLAVVDFHSLEDKLVTKRMRSLASPIEIDDFGNKQQNFELLTKKPILPSEQEIQENIRSRSAKLRILKRLS